MNYTYIARQVMKPKSSYRSMKEIISDAEQDMVFRYMEKNNIGKQIKCKDGQWIHLGKY